MMDLGTKKLLPAMLALAFSATVATAVFAADAPAAKGGNNGIYQKTAPDGAIELSNLPDGEQFEPVATEAQPATPSDTAGEALPTPAGPIQATAQNPIAWPGSVPASAVTEPGMADVLPKIGATLLQTGNPAVGRRYQMMDRDTYNKLNGASTGTGTSADTSPSPAK